MGLPVNIKELIHGKTVEWERLEFKEGWNPEDVLHSVCAFANDFNNWGGGYIFIGIAEKDGQPVLPPKGLRQDEADAIQKKLREFCRRIDPHYFPVVQPEVVEGRLVLVIWVPSGDQRPYSVPVSLAKEKKERAYFIREGAASVQARGQKLSELMQQAHRLPFDERINHDAALSDLDLGCIRTYLQQIGSRLFEESVQMEFDALCRQMRISSGPPEHERPLNLGLMLFSLQPERWFANARIEVVVHDADNPKAFTEKLFTGPVHQQLTEALAFIKAQVIQEKVIKEAGRAESRRVVNFPYEAVEEAMANAVFHKDYAMGKPIEVQVIPNEILTILSYPGPLPPINEADLKKKRIIARDYRNRRLGDFLKELHLTEGRGTGVPLIHTSLERNGSPVATLETNAERSYFLVTIPVHPAFIMAEPVNVVELPEIRGWEDVKLLLKRLANSVRAQVSAQVDVQDAGEKAAENEQIRLSPQVDAQVGAQVDAQVDAQVSAQVGTQVSDEIFDTNTIKKVLTHLQSGPKSRGSVLQQLNLANHRLNYKKWIVPLMQQDWVRFTVPEKPTSSKQQYQLTLTGDVLLHILRKAHG